MLNVVLLLFVTSLPASAQVLVNGGSVTGTISPAYNVDEYQFFANAGDAVFLRVVDLNGTQLDPRIELIGPSNAYLGGGQGEVVGSVETFVQVTGTYTARILDGNTIPDETGDYAVHFVRPPDADEHGSLANNELTSGFLTTGDLDTFTFWANAGDAFLARVVDLNGTSLHPRIWIYDPNGVAVTHGSGPNVGAVAGNAALAGEYTVLVYDDTTNQAESGAYDLHFARIPGASEHGPLYDGVLITGTITMGDLDTFTVSLNTGDFIEVDAEDISGTTFYPQVSIYDPSGTHRHSGAGQVLAQAWTPALQAGTYTVVVSDDTTNNDAFGAYELRIRGASGRAYCFGDGSGTACPCASGAAGEGCANSSGQGGATLSATGAPTLAIDSLQLHVVGVPGNKPGLLLRGMSQLNNSLGQVVGDGLLCTTGSTARSQVQMTSSGATTFTHFQGNSFGASSYGVGLATNYQFWYRDSANTCSGSSFNFSNAWTATWLP